MSLECVSTKPQPEAISSKVSTFKYELPKPLDGGYGWVIVAGSFMCHFLADGCAFSSGVVFHAFLKYFKQSSSITSWISSLFVGIPLLFGPVSSALTCKYGCRKITIIGSIFTIIGFMTASLMDSLALVCLMYGLVAGIGLSLIYVPALVIVAFYFEKKRAFATGLAVCGSGIGTIVFGPLTEQLLSNFGWRKSFLFLGASFVLTIIAGLLFKPLECSKEQLFRETSNDLYCSSKRDVEGDINHSIHQEDQTASLIDLPTYTTSQTVNGNIEKNANQSHPEISKCNGFKFLNSKTTSLSCLNKTAIGYTGNNIISIKFSSATSNINKSDCLLGYSGSLNSFANEKNRIRPVDKDPFTVNSKRLHIKSNLTKNYSLSGTLSRNIHMIDSKQSLVTNFSRQDIFFRGNVVKPSPSYIDLTVMEIDSDTHRRNYLRTVINIMQSLLSELYDVGDLKSRPFMIFSVSNFILYFWYDIPYIFIGHQTIKHGSSELLASLLITIIGIMNTIGQILISYIADKKGVNLILFYSICIMLCGLSVVFIPISRLYVSNAILVSLFGFFISANYALITVLIVKFVGMSRLTKAYGVLNFFCGVANIIGPPLAGKMCDDSGNYNQTFFTAGGFIFLSGLLVLLCGTNSVTDIRNTVPANKCNPLVLQDET